MQTLHGSSRTVTLTCARPLVPAEHASFEPPIKKTALYFGLGFVLTKPNVTGVFNCRSCGPYLGRFVSLGTIHGVLIQPTWRWVLCWKCVFLPLASSSTPKKKLIRLLWCNISTFGDQPRECCCLQARTVAVTLVMPTCWLGPGLLCVGVCTELRSKRDRTAWCDGNKEHGRVRLEVVCLLADTN